MSYGFLCQIKIKLVIIIITLCNVENPTLDFVLFSTSDQHYLNVDPQRLNNVDPTLNVGWEIVHILVLGHKYCIF